MMNWHPAKKRHDAAKAPAPMPPLVIGSHVEAYCAKCKKATSHVLVRKVAAKPTWVQCSACSVEHAFRAPSSAPRARLRQDVPAIPSSATPEEAWKKYMGSARGAAISYSTRDSYRPGQRLAHKSFGEGVVIRQISATVCAAFFVTGEVKLLMGSVGRPAE